jgi:hypothetical protein
MKQGMDEPAMNLRSVLAAMAVFFATTLTASADPRDDLVSALAKCADVSDDHARLFCYDHLTQELKAAASAPATAAPQAGPQTTAQAAAPQPPTDEEKKSWFGFDLDNIFGTTPDRQTTPQTFGSEALPPPPAAPGAPPPPEPLDSISATVSDFALNPVGRFIVFLDNGQVWRQIDGDGARAAFARHGKNEVMISRGALGSYNLQLNGSNRIYKVQRIK